jgi:ComEC/Rec2-related protein
MFHKLESIFNVFIRKARGVVRYINDYKGLQLSVIYIISTYISFGILRNIKGIGTIGLICLLSMSVVVGLILFLPLRNIFLPKRRGSIREDGPKGRVHFFATSVVIAVTVFVAVVKAALVCNHSVDVEQMVRGFTGCQHSFEGYIYDEPDRKHRYQHIEFRLLEDLVVGDEILDKNHGYILVKTENYEKFSVGQVCTFTGTLVEPEGFEEFDYKQYLKNNNIFLIMEDPTFYCWDISQRRAGNTIKNYLIDLKERIIKKVDLIVQEPQSSLLVGILFGKKRLFSTEFDKNVRVAGVSHIVSASGYNITILVLILNKILFFLPKKIKIILGLIVIWLFAIFSGFSSSIVRACIMSSFSHIALLTGRNNTIHITLPLASAIFVFFDPLIIYDIGFLLSISATLGLVYLLPIFLSFKEKLTKKYKFLDEYVFPTMSCTISTLPISVSTFKTFSMWSVPVNAMVLPVIEGTMLWGVLSLLANGIHKPLSLFFISIANLQLKYFEYTVNIIGKLNIGAWEIPDQNVFFISLILTLSIILISIYHYPVENEKYNYYLKDR